jgi:hypothetical protein
LIRSGSFLPQGRPAVNEILIVCASTLQLLFSAAKTSVEIRAACAV